MGKKVLDFRPKKQEHSASSSSVITEERKNSFYYSVYDYLEKEMEEVEEELKKIVEKSPQAFKCLLSELLFLKGERMTAILFLLCSRLLNTSFQKSDPLKAASLDALYLGLHSQIYLNGIVEGRMKEDLDWKDNNKYEQVGRYVIGCSFSRVGGYPEFIRGMTEIVCRNVEASFLSDLNNLPLPFDAMSCRKKYLNKVSYQVASPMALSCALSGWTKGVETSKVELMAYFGHYVGLASQIKIDYQNFIKVIKELPLNEKSRKITNTLPVINLLEVSPFREKLLSSLANEFWSKKEQMLWQQEIKRVESMAFIKSLVNRNCQQALQSIDSFPASRAKSLLVELVNSCCF